MNSAIRDARLPPARVRSHERRLVEAAARSAGVHLTEFIRDVTIERAREELSSLAHEGEEEGEHGTGEES